MNEILTDEIINQRQENMYYQRKRDHKKWYRLLKIMLVDADKKYEAPLKFRIVKNRYIEMLDNTGKKFKLELSDNEKAIIFDLLRNQDNHTRYKITLYQDRMSIYLRIYISPRYIDNLCRNYQLAPRLIETLILNAKGTVKQPSFLMSDIDTYKNITIDESTLPYLTTLKLTPYTHQKNNILWMKNIEKNVDVAIHKFEYIINSDLVRIETKDFTLFLDPKSKFLYNEESLWRYNNRYKVEYFRGGVLCDQVGLGKTLSMIGLILSNPLKKQVSGVTRKALSIPIKKKTISIKPKLKITIKSKKPMNSDPLKSVATTSDASSTKFSDTESVCSQMTTISKMSDISKDSELNIFDTELIKRINKIPDNIEYTSKATIIYCPRRLVGQWKTEINKYIGNKLSVIELSTMTHINKYTSIDLKRVDIILVSFSLLDNKKYRDQERIKLTKFYWHRIIIDEGHEVLLHNVKRVANARINTDIMNTKGKYKWICTGTPLPDTKNSMNGIISFLTNRGYSSQKSSLLDNLSIQRYNDLIEHLFHRNTEASSKGEINIPRPVESTDFLDFTKTERAIYDNSKKQGDKLQMAQLCTNIMIADSTSSVFGNKSLSLNQANSAMSTHFKDKVKYFKKMVTSTAAEIIRFTDKIEQEIKDIESDLGSLKLKLKAAAKADKDIIQDEIAEVDKDFKNTKARKRNRIRTMEDRIEFYKKEIKYNQKQVTIFTSLNIAQFKSHICPITGKVADKLVITPTGQLYSLEGIEMLFAGKKHIRDPLSRDLIEQSDLLVVDKNDKSNTVTSDDKERNAWGTKMAHLVKLLKNIFMENHEHRVIIFSQWKKMLNLIADVLESSRIKFVFCKGNVSMMSSSINKFKTDKNIKVILLSSEDCSSGSNLTEATHICLMDTVNADVENAKAIEEQAIARAVRLGQKNRVVVKRFVMKDTIEETSYRKIYKV